jgi:hypothetical protein
VLNIEQEAAQSAIELARTQLNTGSTSVKEAEVLIEASKDAIALELDEQVCPPTRAPLENTKCRLA